MWTVIYVSQSEQTSKKIAESLLKNGIVSKLRRVKSTDSENDVCCEILVPSTELEAAQDLIFENELF